MSDHYIIFDWQHHGKPGKNDRGATHEDLVELALTAAYIDSAKHMLEACGHRTVVLSYGLYSKRHAYAVEAAKAVKGRCVYVACHVNAGGGNYGLVCHDHRSGGGKRLAGFVSVELGKLVGRTRSEGASSCHCTNAYNTIRGVYKGPSNICGICYEPGFIDSGEHKHLWYADGPDRLGASLAAGIIEFLKE